MLKQCESLLMKLSLQASLSELAYECVTLVLMVCSDFLASSNRNRFGLPFVENSFS